MSSSFACIRAVYGVGGGVTLVAMMMLITLDVVAGYVFNSPIKGGLRVDRDQPEFSADWIECLRVAHQSARGFDPLSFRWPWCAEADAL